jgi:hypothetical protein
MSFFLNFSYCHYLLQKRHLHLSVNLCGKNCQSQDNTAVQRHSVLAKTANVKVNNIKNNQCHVILAVFV